MNRDIDRSLQVQKLAATSTWNASLIAIMEGLRHHRVSVFFSASGCCLHITNCFWCDDSLPGFTIHCVAFSRQIDKFTQARKTLNCAGRDAHANEGTYSTHMWQYQAWLQHLRGICSSHSLQKHFTLRKETSKCYNICILRPSRTQMLSPHLGVRSVLRSVKQGSTVPHCGLPNASSLFFLSIPSLTY